MTGELIFTVGLPRSGKSTWCDQWLRESGPRPRVVLAGDDFRKAAGVKYHPWAEGFVFAALDTAARALLLRGCDVVVDDTHTSEASVLRCMRISLGAKPKWFHTSQEECLRRADATGQSYLAPAIRRMSGQFQNLLAHYDVIAAKTRRRLADRERQDNFLLFNPQGAPSAPAVYNPQGGGYEGQGHREETGEARPELAADAARRVS